MTLSTATLDEGAALWLAADAKRHTKMSEWNEARAALRSWCETNAAELIAAARQAQDNAKDAEDAVRLTRGGPRDPVAIWFDRARQAESNLEAERAIVDRIWDIFGRPTYESLNGRDIYDLINDLKATRDTAVTALQLIANNTSNGPGGAEYAKSTARAVIAAATPGKESK